MTVPYSPFEISGTDRQSRLLVVCDHAANTVPPSVNGGNLGLGAIDMNRHIAFDPGTAGVSGKLAELLDAPLIMSNFSRLVIDPNRGEDDPTLVMKLYDGTIIPGNRGVDQSEIERRKALCYTPYHTALGDLIDRHPGTGLISMHSFTAKLEGRPKRPWHVGVLYGKDAALSRALIKRLRQEKDLCVGENEPYGGHLDGDTIDKHAIGRGRLNTLIEIRNDLIRTPEDQIAWAERLAPILRDVFAEFE